MIMQSCTAKLPFLPLRKFDKYLLVVDCGSFCVKPSFPIKKLSVRGTYMAPNSIVLELNTLDGASTVFADAYMHSIP